MVWPWKKSSRGMFAVLLILFAWQDLSLLARGRTMEVYGTFRGEPMFTVLPPGAIPAVKDPKYVKGTAARAQMALGEPVLGLALGKRPMAYSLWQLDAHEIVNDSVGGMAFAVTW